MKILMVGDYPNDPRLGSAKVPHKLAEELRSLGHTCDLVFAEAIGSRPVRMHARQFVAPWLVERVVSKRFATNGPYDVVDIASGEGLGFGIRRRLGAYRNTAFISRSHGLEHLNYQRMVDDHDAGLLYKPWTRRLWYPMLRLNQVATAARLADRLVVLNDSDRSFAVAKGWQRDENVVVIGHGVSQRFIDNTPSGVLSRGHGILFCGTWTGVKGTDYLVQAFARLIGEGQTTNLTILGGGLPESAIRDHFPHVTQPFLNIVDRVPENKVIEQYRKHDLLAFPSTYEGFGMVVLEAMSQRLPVVASPVGCVTKFICDHKSGLIVPPRSPRDLAAAWQRLLRDDALRQRLGEGAFQSARHATWSHSAQQTLELYEQVVVERQRALKQPRHAPVTSVRAERVRG